MDMHSLKTYLSQIEPTIHLTLSYWTDLYLGDNGIQNFHLGRYIVGYTVGNLVLRRHVSGAIKRDFRTYIRRYTSLNENFEYRYPHSDALQSNLSYTNVDYPKLLDYSKTMDSPDFFPYYLLQ